MSNPEEPLPQLLAPRIIDHARRYWHNAQAIGEPGAQDMREGGAIQAQHALMAQTAALISMAESLDAISTTVRVSARRLQLNNGYFKTLAQEITKLRYLARS